MIVLPGSRAALMAIRLPGGHTAVIIAGAVMPGRGGRPGASATIPRQTGNHCRRLLVIRGTVRSVGSMGSLGQRAHRPPPGPQQRGAAPGARASFALRRMRWARLLPLTVVRSEGITALVATHDEALMDLADEVLRLEDGRIVS